MRIRTISAAALFLLLAAGPAASSRRPAVASGFAERAADLFSKEEAAALWQWIHVCDANCTPVY